MNKKGNFCAPNISLKLSVAFFLEFEECFLAWQKMLSRVYGAVKVSNEKKKHQRPFFPEPFGLICRQTARSSTSGNKSGCAVFIYQPKCVRIDYSRGHTSDSPSTGASQ
jgi:hypothetical protein